MNYNLASQDLDSEPAVSLLERRWFAAQAATRGLQAECDLLLEALELAQAAWQRSRTQLSQFEALSDALGNELAAIDIPLLQNAVSEPRRPVMSAA